MNKKQRDLAIKYSNWTTAFFWTFGVLFAALTIAGMVYSYTNLVGLASEMSYSSDTLKAGFWPLFTEVTMIVLGLLVLIVRLNKWPRLTTFKVMTYTFSTIVILANAFHTSVVSAGFTMSGVLDLAIQELPVIVYLVFLEVALYVITNVLNDRIVMSDSTQNMSDNTGNDNQKLTFEATTDTAKRATAVHIDNSHERKSLVKSFICQVVDKGHDITQERIGEIVSLERQTIVAYFGELVTEGVLTRQAKGQYALNGGNSEAYMTTDVSQWLGRL